MPVSHNGQPDKFLLCSGGMDSVAMTHFCWETFEDELKNPVVVYLDTTIGLPSQRIYVELLSDYYRWPLWILRTEEDFKQISKEHGFYGPQQHSSIFEKLKGRQKQKLITVSGNPHFYWGVYKAESPVRQRTVVEEWEDERGATHHAPIHDKDKEWVIDYIKENDIPYNPNWNCSHCTDCCCGSTASRLEKQVELEAEGYKVMKEKLDEIEQNVTTGDKKETWAWGSFDKKQRQELDAMADQTQSRLASWGCGPDCTTPSLQKQ